MDRFRAVLALTAFVSSLLAPFAVSADEHFAHLAGCQMVAMGGDHEMGPSSNDMSGHKGKGGDCKLAANCAPLIAANGGWQAAAPSGLLSLAVAPADVRQSGRFHGAEPPPPKAG